MPDLLFCLLCLPAAFPPGPECIGEGADSRAAPELACVELVWTDAVRLRVEGRGWTDTPSAWDRLPARAEELVRPAVWNLSHDSAGIAVRFETDATEIHARWSLTGAELAMPHMPATGVSGLDLYVRHEGGWRWLGAPYPVAQTSEAPLARDLAPGRREYLLYLPLYNGVTRLDLGVPAGSVLEPGPARPAARSRPIVFYGTSITQGGCASRPGMTHVAQLGRLLDRPTINLGFSGNGEMDLELAELLGELDAAAFVIDCLPNMSVDQVRERTVPFVLALRAARPDVPILLVEDRSFQNAYLRPTVSAQTGARRAALRAAYDELRTSAVRHLEYCAGADLLGGDGEGTVDGSHPNDLGFTRQTQVFLPVLRKLL